jgi:hypothetical protein
MSGWIRISYNYGTRSIRKPYASNASSRLPRCFPLYFALRPLIHLLFILHRLATPQGCVVSTRSGPRSCGRNTLLLIIRLTGYYTGESLSERRTNKQNSARSRRMHEMKAARGSWTESSPIIIITFTATLTLTAAALNRTISLPSYIQYSTGRLTSPTCNMLYPLGVLERSLQY